MKYALAILPLSFTLLIGVACASEEPGVDHAFIDEYTDSTNYTMKSTILIKIGDNAFTATLFDNASTKAFKAMLPLTINMEELNGNEKHGRLSKNLPTDASNPGTIHSGDLLLWGANTVVVFYKTFPTSYSYTKLGKIDNAAGLAEAVGSGNVTVIIAEQ